MLVFLKAIGTFLLLVIRPVSKAEQALGLLDVLNVILILVYPALHFSIDWNKWFANASQANIIWLLGIPILLLVIAGVKLQYRLITRLRILFDANKYPRCREVIGNRTIYRVAVELRGGKTVDNIHVTLHQMYRIGDRPTSSVLPQELNPSTHQPGTKHGRFSLNPGDPPAFVNVAEWTPGQEIATYYQENYKFKEQAKDGERRREIPNGWPIGEYKLVLVASGNNVPATSKTFYMMADGLTSTFTEFNQR